MKKVFSALFIIVLLFLIGCQQEIVGNDLDEHGCKASAGYTYCEPQDKCLRVWEEDCVTDIELKELIAQANNCKTRDDCQLLGNKCPFGCYVYVNKDKAEKLQPLFDTYKTTCDYACAPSSGVSCNDKKCEPVIIDPLAGPSIKDRARGYCNDKYTEKVFICDNNILKVVSILDTDATYYNADDQKITCPTVAAELMSAECITKTNDGGCTEFC
ncbi:hypothetical protein GOV04_05170 [Candidatus Woesearchaeota archaeon]|nr:hypothetical protein [Candidatus Woesearchaeota archaeon]